MTLPNTAPAGVEISVEKVDASANAVTVSGALRGVPSSIPLTTQYEARTFLSEGNGSWRPTSDHRTAAALNATFVAVRDTAGNPVTNRNSYLVLDEFGALTDIVSEAI